MTYLGDSTISVEKAGVVVKKEEITKKKRISSITESLPHAFRKSRNLYPHEIAYVKDIYGDSIRYDRVRITRDHWFSAGSTRVVGNSINFTSSYGGEYLFEDTPEWGLNKAGLDLLGHEIGHVWQFQNGGWAYAGDALIKQAAGYYSTGSRNTAYDFETAITGRGTQMPNISFDFSGHVAGAPVSWAYDAVSKQTVDVRAWSSQQLADALNAGTIMLSLGDYLYTSNSNVITKTNYIPID